jgi:hypothetical protein
VKRAWCHPGEARQRPLSGNPDIEATSRSDRRRHLGVTECGPISVIYAHWDPMTQRAIRNS